MSEWGRATFGQPCRGCGFDWDLDLEGARARVATMPDRYRAALAGGDGSARHPDLTWSAGAYVCHVTDNLRIWAERLVAAARGWDGSVSPYDPDVIAAGRVYDAVPVEGALWSLGDAVAAWLDATAVAGAAGTGLSHPIRGRQTVLDVVLNNTHDASHHEWDIRRSVDALRDEA